MPKAERGTPKDIANRIKAKGLQKLKFYCQMCEKQCRDQNGFKCHLTSESHLRQMKIFSDNAMGIMDNMSKDFESSYLDTLRRRHGTKRVNANNVYQEVIQDRDHIHMNATKWATLTDFCQYLGRTGKCLVEETERGWYVQYIERDAGILARQEAQERRVEAEKFAEQKLSKQMEVQRVEAAKALDRAGGVLHTEATKLDRSDENVSISLSLNASKKKSSKSTTKIESFLNEDDEDEEPPMKNHGEIMLQELKLGQAKESRWGKIESSVVQPGTVAGDQPTIIDETRPNKKQRHDRDNNIRKDNWICRNILVRIISKKIADGKYYKRKAVVDRVLDDMFTAEIEVLDSGPDARDGGDIIRLDQDDLETVVPKEGKSVRIVNGHAVGKKATVVTLDKKRYIATLKLEDGKILEKIKYEDFSKIW